MRVLVCVTGQKSCEKLIEEGCKAAKELGCALSVLHVAKPGTSFLGNPVEGEAIEYLYTVSSEYGAEMTVLRADDIVGTIVQYARKNEAIMVVVGRSARPGVRDFAKELALRLPEAEIQAVFAEE
ncbi:MAG: universal stress protein [Christensenellales bacterium]|jgi:K+-sensing histidine kinase KdpD